jgi:hypothetical protein
MPTQSTFRIPAAEISGGYGRLLTAYARRTFGRVPDTGYVWWHHRPLLRSPIRFRSEAESGRATAER